MPIITTGVPAISGMASADASGYHKQQQDDQAFAMKLKAAQFELEQAQKRAQREQEERDARDKVLPQLVQSQFGGGGLGPGVQGPPLTAAAGVEQEQTHQKHVEMATQIAPLLGKLDDRTLARVLGELHGQVERDQNEQARKHASDWLDRLGGSFGQAGSDGAKGAVPPEVQQVVDGLKQSLQDPNTDPNDVIKQAMQLAAPKLAQERDDQRAMLLAQKAEAALAQTGKLPSEYAHNQILALQHGIGDTKFFEDNFDKLMAGLEPVGNLWVDSKSAPQVREAMAQAASDKNALAQANAELARMRALMMPEIEAGKAQDRGENLRLRARGLDIRESQGAENLKLRAQEGEAAKESRTETLKLGKRNAEANASKNVLELAQKDPDYADANPEERAAIEDGIRNKLQPKQPIKSETNDAEVALIAKMKAEGKSTAEIKAAVLKMRGGK